MFNWPTVIFFGVIAVAWMVGRYFLHKENIARIEKGKEPKGE